VLQQPESPGLEPPEQMQPFVAALSGLPFEAHRHSTRERPETNLGMDLAERSPCSTVAAQESVNFHNLRKDAPALCK